MNNTDTQKFNDVVTLANTDKTKAYRQLTDLLNSNPSEPNLLLWLTFTAPTLQQSESHLNALQQADPSNSSLSQAKSWLAGEKAKQVVIASPLPIPALPSFEVTPPNQYNSNNVYTVPTQNKNRNLINGKNVLITVLFLIGVALLYAFMQGATNPPVEAKLKGNMYQLYTKSDDMIRDVVVGDYVKVRINAEYRLKEQPTDGTIQLIWPSNRYNINEVRLLLDKGTVLPTALMSGSNKDVKLLGVAYYTGKVIKATTGVATVDVDGLLIVPTE